MTAWARVSTTDERKIWNCSELEWRVTVVLGANNKREKQITQKKKLNWSRQKRAKRQRKQWTMTVITEITRWIAEQWHFSLSFQSRTERARANFSHGEKYLRPCDGYWINDRNLRYNNLITRSPAHDVSHAARAQLAMLGLSWVKLSRIMAVHLDMRPSTECPRQIGFDPINRTTWQVLTEQVARPDTHSYHSQYAYDSRRCL